MRTRVALLGALTLLVALLVIARQLDAPEGLVATFFDGPDWSSAPVRSFVDPHLAPRSFAAAWGGDLPPAFSATWSGAFVALRGGSYTFATSSDDGSQVYVDGQLVVDNGGVHEARRATGSIDLARGVHGIFVTYFQQGGDLDLAVSWARNGSAPTSVPSWVLFPRRKEFGRLLVSVVLRLVLRLAAGVWLAIVLVFGGAALKRPAERTLAVFRRDPLRVALLGIVVGSLIVNVVGIWWGLPSIWAGDELTPKEVLVALDQRFTAGWWDRYPPLQFYVLSAVFGPWLLIKPLGWMYITDSCEYGMLALAGRLVSVAAGAGTLIAVYLCGRRAFGGRTGVYAAAMAALLTLFVYYSKTANPELPYVFWFALSLVFYLRYLDTGAYTDVVLFALAGVAAICTKDQAYALYLLTPIVFIHRAWRANRDACVRHPLARAILDPRLGAAALAASALFAVIQNVAFNAGGFVAHVRDITGVGSQPYRMVSSTLSGRLALLGTTIHLDQRSWGWPAWIVTIAGTVGALVSRRTRRAATALLVVEVSYYVGFINVILYTFDRYLLPVCVIQALFGGFALDRFLARARGRRWRTAVVAGVLAYTFLYAVTVDVLMVRDSRYVAERWLRAHAGSGSVIGTVFPTTVLPRPGRFQFVDVESIADLRDVRPTYFVLNADYARAVEPDRPLARMIAGLQQQTLGYRLVFRYRTPSPWPWLPWVHPDLTGPRLDTRVLSWLHSLNPTVEIYGRVTADPGHARGLQRAATPPT